MGPGPGPVFQQPYFKTVYGVALKASDFGGI